MNRLFVFFFGFFISGMWAQNIWKAPEEAKRLKNPLAFSEEVLKKGEKIFQSLCVSCHGQDGKGDSNMLKTLNPPPADLTSSQVQQQPDGAIFWKISEGRGMMASYKNMLSEEERWTLVHYIRHLAQPKNKDNIVALAEQKPAQELIGNNNVSKDHSKINVFPFTQLVNMKTTHTRDKGFGFGIQHRFGFTTFDESMWRNFLGLDLASNVRFYFEFPLMKRFWVEIGRTRYGKFYDLGVKYIVLKQTADNRVPVTLGLYENIAVTTERPPATSPGATFADGSPFQYTFVHRLYYDTQLMISRKFSKRFSAQVNFQLVWRNLTPYISHPPERPFVIAIPMGIRYKTGLRSALTLEVMPNNHPKTMPFALGYEIASSGNHVFQITLTNSQEIISQTLLFKPTYIPHNGIILGFNLVRYF